MEIIIAAAIFIVIVFAFQAGYSLVRGDTTRPLHSVVRKYTDSIEETEAIDIIYHRRFSSIGLFHKVLSYMPGVKNLDEFLQQTGTKMMVGTYLLMSVTTSIFLAFTAFLLFKRIPLSTISGVFGLFFPYLVLLLKRKKRKAAFESLFPDALDLICYSLKAGHSILASLKMVSEEIEGPVGEEFGYVVEQINFGKSVDNTLRNLAKRIDSTELRYFVTSVIIQRDTGGNLVEILTKISSIIRLKFRFRERVKALAAEGKLSAIILIALPFFVGGVITITNRTYLTILLSDPLGMYFIVGAAVLMALGMIVMYRLVQLDM